MQRAVRAIQVGGRVEDDRVECKTEWPHPSKARQLAGAANRAAGEFLLWIIGIDEATGELHPLDDTDPADWWPAVAKRFDQTPPDLAQHLRVFIAPEQSVIALCFRTDRFPYVVKTMTEGPYDRDVPMREGTRTRSAYRHELIELLVPAVSVPPAKLLQTSARGSWSREMEAKEGRSACPETTQVAGQAQIFLEYVGANFVALPGHLMEGFLVTESVEVDVHPRVRDSTPIQGRSPEVPPRYGVTIRQSGVLADGPGTFVVDYSAEWGGDLRGWLSRIAEWELRLKFGVAGARRAIQLNACLVRKPDHEPLWENDLHADVATWSYGLTDQWW